MKRGIVIFTLCLLAFQLTLKAQWTDNGNNLTTSDNIGIGTTSPGSSLDINKSMPAIILRYNQNFRGSLSSYERLRLVGSTSDYIISIQDGSGRVQQYWNASVGTTNNYLISNEEAGKIYLNPNQSNIFGIKWADKGTAGDSISWKEYFTIANDGNVGIGVTNPTSLLQIGNGSGSANNKAYVAFGKRVAVSETNQLFIGQDCINGTGNDLGLGARSSSGGINFYAGGDSSPFAASKLRMRVTTTGNVLIGKTTQTNTSYKLDVNGNIRANKVVVNTTGADFVFDPAYQPPSPDSLRSFIKIHHHLPGIPAASEMQQQGLDIGTNQALLLQKIEELTLYILRQDSVQQVLLDRLSQQQAQINALNHTRTLTGNKK